MTPDPTPAPDGPAAPTPPDSLVEPARRHQWVWLLPLCALALAVILGYQQAARRGVAVTVTFAEGHGLRVDAPVRCRGIDVGRVESVELTPELTGVVVKLRLTPTAAQLARADSAFWVVRPELTLSQVSGLDTLAGARYVAVRSGGGAKQSSFTGLEHAPQGITSDDDALEITLESPTRGSVTPGSPVSFRQVVVGKVLAVGLASDARGVEVRLAIQRAYASLVRGNTVFWNASGVDWSLGWRGLRVEAESLAAVLEGGIALATPDESAEPARNGHRFTLHARAEPTWLKWQPALAVGPALWPNGMTPPEPRSALASRPGTRAWSSTQRMRGWVLPVAGGLLGPEALLSPQPPESKGPATLEAEGLILDLTPAPSWSDGGLAVMPLDDEPLRRLGKPWPSERIRPLTEPEDLVVVTQGQPPLPIDRGRLAPEVPASPGRWRVELGGPDAQALFGAPVVSRRDGALVGLLLPSPGGATLAPVTRPAS